MDSRVVSLGLLALSGVALASQAGNGPWDPNTPVVQYHSANGGKTDCGAAKYSTVLMRTHTLVNNEGQMSPFISETISMGGALCNRVVFSIGEDGKAKDISFGESSLNRALDKSALDALKGYLFYQPGKNEKNQFMIIFHSYSIS